MTDIPPVVGIVQVIFCDICEVVVSMLPAVGGGCNAVYPQKWRRMVILEDDGDTVMLMDYKATVCVVKV